LFVLGAPRSRQTLEARRLRANRRAASCRTDKAAP
jgi:hypothetical protein